MRRRVFVATSVRDISNKTGLSYTTVAQILRNRPGYSKRSCKKVLEVAKKMDYRPNYLSKALAGGKSMSIGLVVGSIENILQIRRIHAIEVAAREAGYLSYIVICPEGEDASHMQSLLDRRIDGLLFNYCVAPPQKVQKFLAAQSVPIVYINWAPEDASHCVRIDWSKAIKQVAGHLAGLGHRSARYMPVDFDLKYPRSKLEPYREALTEVGIHFEVDHNFAIPGADPGNEARDAVRRLVAAGKVPTALLMSNDETAMGAVAALKNAGLRVPEDVNVVGFDDLEYAALAQPSLTTIRQPFSKVSHAFKMLKTLMNNPEAAVSLISLDCELVVRQSTGNRGKDVMYMP